MKHISLSTYRQRLLLISKSLLTTGIEQVLGFKSLKNRIYKFLLLTSIIIFIGNSAAFALATLPSLPGNARSKPSNMLTPLKNSSDISSIKTADIADFGDSFSKGIGYRLDHYIGGARQSGVDLRLNSLSASLPMILGNRIIYQPSNDMLINYQVDSHKVKEDIIINRKPDSNILTFSLNSPNLTAELAADGYHLKNLVNEDVFLIENPTIVDAAGKKGTIKLNITGDTVYITIDKQFLDRAVYPVTIDPTVVATSSNVYATSLANQRKTFYDGNNYWIFYSDGADLTYRYSADGANWSSPITAASGVYAGYLFSVLNNGNDVYVVYSGFVKQGTINGTTITWSNAYEAIAGSGGDYPVFSALAQDSTGRIWIITRYTNGTNYWVKARRSQNANDITVWQPTIYDLSDTANTSWFVMPNIVPLPNNQMYALWTSSTTIAGKLFNGAGFDAASTPIAQLPLESVTVVPSALTDGNGKIYLAYNKNIDPNNLVYKTSSAPYNSWSSETAIITGGAYFPSLSLDGSTNEVYVFYDKWVGDAQSQPMTQKIGSPHAVSLADSSERPFDVALSYSAVADSFSDVTAAAANAEKGDVKSAQSNKLLSIPGDYFYAGLKEEFDSVFFDLNSTNTASGLTLDAYYWNGANWSPLTLNDKTNNLTLSEKDVTFDPPADWQKTNGYYYVAFYTSTTPTVAPIGDQITAYKANNFVSAAYGGSVNPYALFTEGTDLPFKVKIVRPDGLIRLGEENYYAGYNLTSSGADLFINLANGNLALILDGFEVPNQGGNDLNLYLTYNSMSAGTAGFGYGWTISPNLKLIYNQDNTFTYIDSDGSRHLFVQQPDGTYLSPPGLDLDLRLTADSSNPVELNDYEGNSYVFNDQLLLAKEQDNKNNTVNYYYSGGKLSSIVNAAGKTTNFTYNPSGFLEKITDPVSQTINLSHSGGDLSGFTDQNGKTISFTYQNHQLTGIADAQGETVIAYDSQGRLKSITDPRSTPQQPITTTFNYYPGRTTVSDPFSKQTTYYYNPAGNLTKKIDPVGNTKNFSWQDNALTGQSDVNSELNLSYANDDLTSFQFKIDSSRTGQISATYLNHKLASLTDANNLTTTFSTESIGNNGERRKLVDARGKVMEKDYDSYGNLIKISNWHNQGTKAFNSWYFTYNSTGDYLRFVTDPNGGVTSYGYDTADNSQQRINPRGYITKYYLKSKTQSFGEASPIVRTVDALSQETTYAYDGSGNLSGVKDARGHITDFHYNQSNLLDQVVNPLGKYTYLTYDIGSKLSGINYPNGNSVGYTYDDARRLKAINYLSAATTDTYQFGYQSGTNNVSTVTSGPGSYQYSYNNADWLTKATDPFGLIQSYDYLNGGQLSQLKIGAESTTTYNYQNNLLSAIIDPQGNTSSFSYDGRRNLTAVGRPNNTSAVIAYDQGNRVTSISQLIPGNNLNIDYAYDADSNITSETLNAQVSKYSYDALDRLINWTNAAGIDTTYTYDAGGNLTQKGSTAFTYNAANELTSDGVHNYTYDANGSMLSDGVNTYTYDGANRLISFSSIAGVTRYTYDYKGRRITKTLPGGQTIDYHYLGMKLIAETDASATIATYTYTDKGRLYSTTRGSQTYYYHLNIRGDVLALTDPSGNIVAQYSYDPWGTVLAATGTLADQPFRYASYHYDSESGMYYLTARYYKPSISRFITQDPKPGDQKKPMTFNFYAYGNDNPLRYVDPLGTCWWDKIINNSLTHVQSTFSVIQHFTLYGALAGFPPAVFAYGIEKGIGYGLAGVSETYTYYQYSQGNRTTKELLETTGINALSMVPVIEPVSAVLAEKAAAETDYSKKCPEFGGSPPPLPYGGQQYSGSVNDVYVPNYYSFYATPGMAYVNFDADWTNYWYVSVYITDTYGNVVWQYTSWYNQPQPVQNGSFVMRATGLYTVRVQIDTWKILTPSWTPTLNYNFSVIYP